MKADFQKILSQINFQKNQKLLTIVTAVVLFLAIASLFMPAAEDDRDLQYPLSIPAIGLFPSLDQAMVKNKSLRSRVERITKYDEGFLFANYRKINSEVADILFLWSGMKPDLIKQKDGRELVEIFIRRLHNLPYSEPVYDNPFIGEDPWPNLFARFKAQLLMQGNGYKVYEGSAYYNSVDDQMVIEGTLSKKFVRAFGKFLESKPADERRRFINNFLSFVEETKGINNLTSEEKAMLRDLGA